MSRILSILFLLIAGCGAPAEVTAQQAPTPVVEAPAGPVTRIVFIGQQEACDCTIRRIADVTAALSAAMGTRQMEIENLYVDREQDRDAVEMHREMRAFMVAPALFFFDADGRLADMTQGEVNAEALGKILGR